MVRAALESVISSLNVNIFAILLVAFSTNTVANDVVSKLREKNPLVTESGVYFFTQGFFANNTFYENLEKVYEEAETQTPLCLFLFNMHIASTRFLNIQTEEDLKKIDIGPLDLRYFGAMDPLEIYSRQTYPIAQKGSWTQTYFDNIDKIKTCLSNKFNFKNEPIIYDTNDIKNTLLETYYMRRLSNSTLKLGRTTFLTYSFPPTDLIKLFNKPLNPLTRDTIMKLKAPGLNWIGPGGNYEVALECRNTTDTSMSDINHYKDLTAVSCKIRLLREECTDTSYMINTSISQYMKYQAQIKVLKIYMIHAYEQKGGKLEINNPYTLNGKTTSNWDYHVASLVMLQDQSNKELYIAVIDNFFSKFPMTLNEWFKLFSPNQIIKYRLVPFIRSEDREHKYMAYEKAKSEAEKTKRTPPKFY